mmetsp:Transcript_22736/g.32653  ORF Transcript_22736/g.32653 Transcript_22736/m.32653 type:complete len:411 (+) Transcript_22736:270-1502(+)
MAFCSYTILEESSDVMVVLDAKEDSRFSNTSLVVGPPYIRFYAGAALYVNKVKVGTLAIIDSVPRTDFNENLRQNLIELGSLVAYKIEMRRLQILRVEKDLAQLSMTMVYSLKYPLDRLNGLMCELQSFMDASLAANNDEKQLINDPTNASELIQSKLTTSAFQIEQNITNQIKLMESSIAISHSFVQTTIANPPHEKRRVTNEEICMEQVNFSSFFTFLNNEIRSANPLVHFHINFDSCKKIFAQSPFQLSYPNLITMIIYSAFYKVTESHSYDSVTLDVSIELEDPSESNMNMDNIGQFKDGQYWIQHPGKLILTLTCCKTSMYEEMVLLSINSINNMSTNIESSAINDLTEYRGSFCMEWFDMVLKSIGGSYKVYSGVHSNSPHALVCHEVVFPGIFPIYNNECSKD